MSYINKEQLQEKIAKVAPECYGVVNKLINELPTIEPKRGRWKPFDLTWGRSVYACTNCGEAFEVPTENGKPMYAYCPNCGAKMDEVEE